MKIAGIHKLSLIDYPGKLACIVFTQGCNFRCGFCYNPELVLLPLPPPCKGGENSEWTNTPKSPLKEGANFFEFLESRKDFLDGVCISGGEPLLQEDLEEFIRDIKEKGFLIKLDTNGFLSYRLEKIIKKKLVDYIAMDVKTAVAETEHCPISTTLKYSRVAGVEVDIEEIKRSVKLIMESGLDYEFRTTVIKNLHNIGDVLKIARFIKGAKKYVLQKFEIRDKILDEKFLNFSSIIKDEAEEWKKECERFVEKCELRGWE